jgi:two-component system cell cycle response regulator
MGARILVIEDNAANIELMVYLLEASGHVTSPAQDGEEGLRVATQQRPDLVVCDIRMPRMNGYEFAQALKARADLRAIPLVAVSAFAMAGDREKALAAGFDGYLTKPIDPASFVAQLEEYLPPALRGMAPVPAAPSGITDAMAPPRGYRILLVDDNRANLDFACSLLNYAGYQAVAATDLDDAHATARSVSPSLIISDVVMPVSNGFEFIRTVKSDPELKAIPFIFLTSTATDEKSRQVGLALGAAEYLFRPIEAQELLDVVDKCLRGNEISAD